MIALVTSIHVIVCIVLILVILLQAGKGGGGIGAAFGGGSQTVFGGRGGQTFLGKVTSVCAAVFMLTSLTLAYHASHARSVVRPPPAAPLRRAPTGSTPLSPGAPVPASPAPTTNR